MNAALSTIAVDLTALLPGGENGGAKIFVIELLRQLALLAPTTQFILLTHGVSHAALASLDSENVSRQCVIGHLVQQKYRTGWKRVVSKGFALLPRSLAHKMSSFIVPVYRRLKRGRMQGVLSRLGVNLLFCPFTAPNYAEPGIPIVSTIYDLQYKTHPEFFEAVDLANRDQVFRMACKQAHHLVAISEYSRGKAIYHGKLSEDQISTIYLRMAQRIVPHKETKIVAQLNLKAEHYFLYPANFWLHKNHERLVLAFDLFYAMTGKKEFQLVCTGSPGERQQALAEWVRDRGLEGRVIFPGYLTHSELGTLLVHARGVIFPSLYEGFGMPVMEAMANGIPVACSNLTSLPEVVGQAALLFDPLKPEAIAKSMQALDEDEALRKDLIKAGRERAAIFSDITQMAKDYWNIFQQVYQREKGILG